MPKIMKTLLPVLVLLLALVLAFGVFPKLKQAPEKKERVRQAAVVDTLEVRRHSLRFEVESQGVVRPRTQTSLVAEVVGQVVALAENFVSGSFVATGEVLLEIDPSDYRVGVKRAEAALASRQAQLSSEQARSEQALKDWQRMHGRDSKPNDLVLRLPQLAEAKANVRAAEADLERARRELERTRIKMPYDGMVREKLIDQGQYVTPGARLATVFSVDLAEVRLPVTVQELEYIQLPDGEGMEKPAVTLTDSRGNQWQARIDRSEGVVDEKSRQVYLVAQVRDPYGLLGESHQDELKMGTFVRARITGRQADNLYVIPRHSLGDSNRVMVVSSDRTLEFRDVEIARMTPQNVYITSGLSDGDQVVATALTAPVEGMALRVRKQQTEDEVLEVDDVLDVLLDEPMDVPAVEPRSGEEISRPLSDDGGAVPDPQVSEDIAGDGQ